MVRAGDGEFVATVGRTEAPPVEGTLPSPMAVLPAPTCIRRGSTGHGPPTMVASGSTVASAKEGDTSGTGSESPSSPWTDAA